VPGSPRNADRLTVVSFSCRTLKRPRAFACCTCALCCVVTQTSAHASCLVVSLCQPVLFCRPRLHGPSLRDERIPLHRVNTYQEEAHNAVCSARPVWDLALRTTLLGSVGPAAVRYAAWCVAVALQYLVAATQHPAQPSGLLSAMPCSAYQQQYGSLVYVTHLYAALLPISPIICCCCYDPGHQGISRGPAQQPLGHCNPWWSRRHQRHKSGVAGRCILRPASSIEGWAGSAGGRWQRSGRC
jgi:hypothetical protein